MASDERNGDESSQRTSDGDPDTDAEHPSVRNGETGTVRVGEIPEELDEGGQEVEGDEQPPIEIEPLDTPIEAGTIDPENALFVVLGIVLTVLVVVRFLSVLP